DDGVWRRDQAGRGGNKNVRRVYDFNYTDAKGDFRWVKGEYTNLEEAREARAELLHSIKHGFVTDGRRTTLETFATKTWLPEQEFRVQNGKLRRSSANQYARD